MKKRKNEHGQERKTFEAYGPPGHKQAPEDSNIAIFYGAVFNNVDHDYDVIVPGAFTNTIPRIKSGRVPLYDGHGRKVSDVIGHLFDAEEDDFGLLCMARISEAPSAQDAKQKILDGSVSAFSIGYDSIVEQYERREEYPIPIRVLKEVRVWEISAVPIPANDEARLVSIKSRAVPHQGLPLASVGHVYKQADAVARVKAWAEEAKPPQSPIMRYKRAFVGIDRGRADTFQGYSLPIADVVDGELKAIPQAVLAAGADAIERQDKAAQEALAPYYEEMDRAAPWDGPSVDAILARCEAGIGDFEQLKEANNRVRRIVESVAALSIRKAAPQDARGPETKEKLETSPDNAERLLQRGRELRAELWSTENATQRSD